MEKQNAQLLELPVLFKCLVKRMTQEWKNHISGQLTITQFRMMFILNSEGPRKAMDLAEALGVTSGAVTGIADKLIDRGYVVRERDETDRRVVFLEITNQGKIILEALLESQRDLLHNFFRGLPEEDIQHLRRIFTQILNQFNEQDRG